MPVRMYMTKEREESSPDAWLEPLCPVASLAPAGQVAALRYPQSVRSVPHSQRLFRLPVPPSSHRPFGCRSAVVRGPVWAVVAIGAARTHTIGAVVANAVVNIRGDPARVVVRGRRCLCAQTGGRNILLETAVVVGDVVSVVTVYHRDSAVVPRAIAQPVSLDALSDNVCDRDAGIRLHSDAECGGGGSSGAEAGGERGLQRGGRGGGRDRNRGGDDHAGSCYANGYRSGINASVGGDRASEGGAPDDRGGSGDGGGGLATYRYGGGGDAYQYGGGGALRHV
eukprot:scaffold36340_cov63-Phaeocystis_antarctica.AAC.1